MQLHTVQMTLLGGLFAGLACAGAQALPTEPAPAGPDKQAGAPPPDARAPSTQQESSQVEGWGSPAREARLSGARGGADTATASADARLNATVTNNTATNISTGSNIIDNGSFANMSGLPMVIQNSGTNVLIQNATIINLQLK